MRSQVRIWLVGLLTASIVTLMAAIAPAAEAGFGVESWFAATCNATHESCHKAAKASEEVEKAHEKDTPRRVGIRPSASRTFASTRNRAANQKGLR